MFYGVVPQWGRRYWSFLLTLLSSCKFGFVLSPHLVERLGRGGSFCDLPAQQADSLLRPHRSRYQETHIIGETVAVRKATPCTLASRRIFVALQGNCQDPGRCVGTWILSPNRASGIRRLGHFARNPANLPKYGGGGGKDGEPTYSNPATCRCHLDARLPSFAGPHNAEVPGY